ncbi:MAG: hypothetical protein KC462_07855 [Cyanobacteria bacterium HKST-UBA05]|nr:hypothetical protein [Cyanobacteria bacterium HKST-UBA05]
MSWPTVGWGLDVSMPQEPPQPPSEALSGPLEYRRPTCEATAENPVCVTPTMKETLEQTRSEGFQAVFSDVVGQAKAYLQGIAPDSRKVVVVDLDETLVSNLPFWEKVGVYDKACWSKWMRSPKVGYYNAPVRELVGWAKAQGFSVMFITGRSANDSAPTLRDLNDIEWDGTFFRPEGNDVRSQPFKAHVRQLLRDLGYEIVLNLGDQTSDFDLPIETSQGEFLVPNLIYAIP